MAQIDKVQASIPSKVVVHPLVLLSIVDHYKRVAQGTKRRVVGCLIGVYEKGLVHVTNSYAVPFEEDKDVWFLDHVYHEDMYKKIQAKEKIVGWYSTGPTIHKNDIEINEKFKLYNSNPVYVVCKVQEHDEESIPAKSYCSIEEVDQDGSLVKNFIHVPSIIDATEAE